MKQCDGCGYMVREGPHKRGDCYTVHCTDPDKPVLGARRTIAIGWTGYPVDVPTPAWCRGKEPL